MKRINNFHKSKPIVQNVKTDSVNEGKAPKNLTLANDISDWNPGISHEQLSEAESGSAPTFEDAIGGKDQKSQGGGAAAPTSYSEEVNRFLVVRGAQNRFTQANKEYNTARRDFEALQNERELASKSFDELSDDYDQYSREIQELTQMRNEASAKDDQVMIDRIDNKMNSIKDMNQEMVTKYNTISSELDVLDRNIEVAEKTMEKSQSTGEAAIRTLKGYGGKIPQFEKDPDLEAPIKEPEDPANIKPVDGMQPIDDVFIEVPKEVKDAQATLDRETLDGNGSWADASQDVKTVDAALKDAESSTKAQSAELQNPDKELLPTDAKTVVREFSPEDDMHAAVKAGGIGLDIIADGARVEAVVTYFRFKKCGVPGVQYYTTINLDKRNFPSDWETNLADGNQLYVTDGSSTTPPILGEVDGTSILDLVDYDNGNYDGATGLTCLP